MRALSSEISAASTQSLDENSRADMCAKTMVVWHQQFCMVFSLKPAHASTENLVSVRTSMRETLPTAPSWSIIQRTRSALYLHLKILMIPASNVCEKDVVLGGRKNTRTLAISTLSWGDTLFNNSSTFGCTS
ncbi:hypothetical protein Plhal304r1_c069g0157811 [Plasmopara halstedii]